MNTTSIPVHTFFNNGSTEYAGNISVIQSISLPDGTSYGFGYDSGTTSGHYGDLISLTLPTGGSINYGYSLFKDSYNGTNRWITSRVAGPGSWTYTPQLITSCSPTISSCQQQVTTTTPAGDNTVRTFSFQGFSNSATKWGPGLTQVQSYAGTVSPSNLVATVTNTWDAQFKQKQNDTVSVPTAGGATLSRTEQYTYGFLWNQNVTQLSEWKYYTGSLPATPDRVTAMTYTDTNSSYVTKHIFDKPTSVTVKNGSGVQISQANYIYDSSPLSLITGTANHDDTNFGTGNTVRGNLTQIQKWIGGSSYLTTAMVYDTTGQLRSIQDPSGNVSSFDYSDSFFDDNGSNPPPPHSGAPATNAYLTSTHYPLSISESSGYYYGTGRPESHKDFNNNSTYFHYVDTLSRPTATAFPDGGSVTQTYTGQNQLDVYTAVNASTTKHSKVMLDSFGRKNQTVLVSDPQGSDTVDFGYNNSGQLSSVTNPHRSTALPTDGTTTYTYDALGRVIATTQADGSQGHAYFGPSVSANGGIGSQLCSSTTYGLGYPTLVVDEAQKKRQSWADGFGRLIEVDEPDTTGTLSIPTCYTYDLQNNLLGVLQNGSRQRTFAYDSISRLTSATNPESGTASYKYDSDTACAAPNSFSGQLVSRTDARGIRTCLQYDALNRVTAKNYSDGTTPTLYFSYDVNPGWMNPPSTNLVGRLVEAYNQYAGQAGTTTASAILNSYDTMGRVVRQWQQTPSTSPGGYFVYQTYDLAGNITSLANPANVTISYTYDAGSKPVTVTSSWVDAQHPGTLYAVDPSVGYLPSGEVRKATLANGLTEAAMYNTRLQPCRMEINSAAAYFSQCTDAVPSGNLLDFTYGYNSGSANNGNVATWSALGNQTFTRSYGYDSLNRLSSMSDTAASQACKGLSWTVDAWGNLTDQTQTSGSCLALHVSAGTNNRLLSPYLYDAAGNMTNDGTHSYAFDAENHLAQVDGGATASYVYDAQGRRIRKSSAGSWTEYFYGTDGNVTAEKTPSAYSVIYAYFGTQLVVQYRDNTTYSIFKDHLGSTRLITKLDKSVFDSPDFLPFGAQTAGDTGSTHKFAGKERDSESNLDNFLARYNSSALGRFMSPDPLGGDIGCKAPR